MRHDEVRAWIEEQGFSVHEPGPWSKQAYRLALDNHNDAEPLMNMFQLLFGDQVHINRSNRRYPALLQKSQLKYGVGILIVWVPEGNTDDVYMLDTARIGQLFGDSDE